MQAESSQFDKSLRTFTDFLGRYGSDPLAYRALCRWVDRIQEERQCDAGDPQADPRLRGQLAIAPEAVDPAAWQPARRAARPIPAR